jgi:hypothetical protein
MLLPYLSVRTMSANRTVLEGIPPGALGFSRDIGGLLDKSGHGQLRHVRNIGVAKVPAPA